jgi:ABC-type phosphate transport system substrate-binding protein
MKTAILSVLLVSILSGAEYAVVVSKKSPISSLTLSQLRDIFLQKRRSIGEYPVIPVNVLGREEGREQFELRILGMDRNRLNAYWVKQHFQGVTPPLTQSSFESVRAFVENVEGAIGYIPVSMVDGRVKALHEF